jgi:hypothetical protein
VAADTTRLLNQFQRRLRHWARRVAGRPPRPAARERDEWSIGIYSGETPLSLRPDRGARNPVLTRWDVTDCPARFVADPFLLPVAGTWHMFFEVWNRATHRGEIGLATSAQGRQWQYQRIVLAEPFHLSYPYVFEAHGGYYLIPESHKDHSIRLYQAERFPDRWTCAATLLSGQPFADASVFEHEGRWWLFTETSPEGKFDTLRLYSAPALLGPWQEHPQSPLITGNSRTARPAGRVVDFGGCLFRFAQDCREDYGTSVSAFQIVELTPTRYQEIEVSDRPFLAGSGAGWNAAGMHHVDLHPHSGGGWIASVDGRVRLPKAAPAATGAR